MQFQNQLVQDCQRVKPVFTLHLRRGWLSHCFTECSSACSLSWVQLWFSFALFCPETLVDPGWHKKSQLWRYEIHSLVITVGSHLRILLNILDFFYWQNSTRCVLGEVPMRWACLVWQPQPSKVRPTIISQRWWRTSFSRQQWLLRFGC